MGELTCSQPNISWDRLTFSAKESVYKAWFPTYGKWLDFTDWRGSCFIWIHIVPTTNPKNWLLGATMPNCLNQKDHIPATDNGHLCHFSISS